MRELPRPAVVALSCVIAVVANLIVYGCRPGSRWHVPVHVRRDAGRGGRRPADFDTASTATLAVCHVTLVPISIAAVVAIGRRTQATRAARAKA